MKGFETGKDKVKKICDVLKKETLEPAKEEAERIIAAAKLRGKRIRAARFDRHLPACPAWRTEHQENFTRPESKQSCFPARLGDKTSAKPDFEIGITALVIFH